MKPERRVLLPKTASTARISVEPSEPMFEIDQDFRFSGFSAPRNHMNSRESLVFPFGMNSTQKQLLSSQLEATAEPSRLLSTGSSTLAMILA